MEARLDANHTALQAALNSADKAMNKADVASEKRFESINEFRGNSSSAESGLAALKLRALCWVLRRLRAGASGLQRREGARKPGQAAKHRANGSALACV
jgi:hypothetical protein